MDHPQVSVVIPNYNYARYLPLAIESVVAQTYHSIEIIVVDDGSTDGSRNIIESYHGKVRAIFQKNQGVSAARNTGVAASTGEYIAVLDADDIWLPEKIEKQVGVLIARPSVAMVHTALIEIDQDGNHIGECNEGREGDVSVAMLEFESPVILGGGSSILVRRRAFDEVGGFDTRLSTSADWDFCYSVAAKFAVGYVPEPLLLYRQHGSNMHSNIKLMEHDMMLGFDKAFSKGTNADRRKCYGNLHMTLSGSYFRTGEYGEFAKHATKSIWNRPSNLAYFLKFPLRRLRSN